MQLVFLVRIALDISCMAACSEVMSKSFSTSKRQYFTEAHKTWKNLPTEVQNGLLRNSY